jgi:hypothetical protein
MKFEKCFFDLLNYQYLQGSFEELEDFMFIAA